MVREGKEKGNGGSQGNGAKDAGSGGVKCKCFGIWADLPPSNATPRAKDTDEAAADVPLFGSFGDLIPPPPNKACKGMLLVFLEVRTPHTPPQLFHPNSLALPAL